MKNLKAATSKEAVAMSVEAWFAKYGVAILEREATQNLKARAARAGQ